MNVENNVTPLSSDVMMEFLKKWVEELHQTAPDSIGDLTRFHPLSCEAEKGEYLFSVDTAAWMQNPVGTLHGGISATLLDQGMGMVATCLTKGEAFTPTVQLNVTFHRSLLPGKNVLLKVYVESITRTMIYLRSEAKSGERTDSLCVSGTGIYYIKWKKQG